MSYKFNYKIYIAIFLILLVILSITVFLYEGVKMEISDYGSFGNSLILSLAELFQFPFNTIVNPSSDVVYFIGVFINIGIYSMIIYFVSRLLLKRTRRE
jgi:hypothetical protein